MREFANMFGWIAVWCFGVAVLNFFVKYIFKNYITPYMKKQSAQAKKYENIINIYKKVMKYVVKYHKVVGVIVGVAVLFHLVLEIQYSFLSITGLIAAILMLAVILLGILGVTVFKRKPRGAWIKIHRLLAFLLIVSILLHLALK